MHGNQKIILIIGAVTLMAIVAGLFLALYQNQQQLEAQLSEKERTAVALATAGTAEAVGGTAQAATSTAFAVKVTAAGQGTATAQSAAATAQAATATAQAAAATAQAQRTATAQAQASATAQAIYREKIITKTVGTMNTAAELTTAIFSIQEVANPNQELARGLPPPLSHLARVPWSTSSSLAAAR